MAMHQSTKPLRPELRPLVEVLARAAYEAIQRGAYKEAPSPPNAPEASLLIPVRRPAA